MSSKQVVAVRTRSGWALSPAFGFYAGKTIATAEQLTMVNVQFKGTYVIGDVVASHGTMITEDRADLATVKALGVGGVFRRGPNCFPAKIVGEEYISQSGSRLYKASYAALTMGGLFYAP